MRAGGLLWQVLGCSPFLAIAAQVELRPSELAEARSQFCVRCIDQEIGGRLNPRRSAELRDHDYDPAANGFH